MSENSLVLHELSNDSSVDSNDDLNDDSSVDFIEEIEKIKIDENFTTDNYKTKIINEIIDLSVSKSGQNRIKDKSDYAVAEKVKIFALEWELLKVIDRHVALILYRFRNKGTLESIYGCISTGKEANVYYAIGNGQKEVAIKIYKTSILDYKYYY